MPSVVSGVKVVDRRCDDYRHDAVDDFAVNIREEVVQGGDLTLLIDLKGLGEC